MKKNVKREERKIVFRVNGEALRELMKERGVGVNELAKKVSQEIGTNLTGSAISQLWSPTKQTKEPAFNTIHAIARALGVPVASFCEGFPPPDAREQWMAFFEAMSDSERALMLEMAKPILRRGRQ